ncbi:methyltransferase domain-containing protein [Robiginitalea sp. M366]|uniref:RsmB/NOP family class I SAM-dependent RNA methyltransferase n=1 Tax=Robiginitalea aestuariiviva TaxID=3036903 RepID=UPI00240DF644|nr:methyltransferase domain-containing protein [Robiginitalea aestuariiviva]MDG1573464.1 methyltransferase domain-containing protein [Robiginitalea aestuariiviva]
MRFHRNLVEAVLDGADQIFNQGQYADKAVERLLKRDKRWGSRDRGFIAETLYELVRYKRLYAAIAEVKDPFSREDLQRIFAVWAILKGHRLPPWEMFASTPTRRIKGRYDTLKTQRKYRESVPDWLDALGEKSLGEGLWEQELHAQNEPAPVVLRANTLKGDRKKLQQALAAEQIASKPLDGLPEALELEERPNVFRTQAFQDGAFEVQDASSQQVAHFLQAAPGMRVVDTCAGAGGKTLHLAALMENKGQLLAMDIYGNKLQELKRRARRAGAFNIETRVLESTKPLKRLAGTADRVLIDAPCTGLGVLRRNPDAKWKLQPEFLKEITGTQQEILQRYSRLVKPGGKLVYATCSILPAENAEQVQTFLASEAGKAFRLEGEKSLLASRDHSDGFYMARLVREG